jgi:hypothetical protein
VTENLKNFAKFLGTKQRFFPLCLWASEFGLLGRNLTCARLLARGPRGPRYQSLSCCPASLRAAPLRQEPEPLRAMQTPATICGARGAAFTPCPRRPTPPRSFRNPFTGPSRWTPRHRLLAPMASTVDSPGSSSDFAKRIDRAWLISQVPP